MNTFKPVDMTHLNHGEEGAENGDCMRACIASLLGRDDVPHFCAGPDADTQWVHRTQEWLSKQGYWFIELPFQADQRSPIQWYLLQRCISPLVMVGGQSPRGDWGHWVVAELSRDGLKLVHDPHPSRDGIVGDPEDIGLLVHYVQAGEE